MSRLENRVAPSERAAKSVIWVDHTPWCLSEHWKNFIITQLEIQTFSSSIPVLPYSDTQWLSPQPSSGTPGGRCWLCHNVPQHGWRPNQTISLLQEIHLANSPQGSRFGWSNCHLYQGRTKKIKIQGMFKFSVWVLLTRLGSSCRPGWQPTATCGADICLWGLSVWRSPFPSADIGSTG